MPANGLWHFILWIHYLALSLWIGGITFISLAAPAIHGSMASKAVAGQIVGRILKRLNPVEITCALVLLTTSLCAFRFVRGKEQWLGCLILVITLMGLLSAFYTFHLTPRLESLKEQIPTLEALSPVHAAKIEFDRLHRIYVKLMTLNLALGLVVLYGSVVILK